jgi:hypothetical protein
MLAIQDTHNTFAGKQTLEIAAERVLKARMDKAHCHEGKYCARRNVENIVLVCQYSGRRDGQGPAPTSKAD